MTAVEDSRDLPRFVPGPGCRCGVTARRWNWNWYALGEYKDATQVASVQSSTPGKKRRVQMPPKGGGLMPVR